MLTNKERKLSSILANSCSTVLSNLRCASLCSIDIDIFDLDILKQLCGAEINFYVLKQVKNAYLTLVYREESLIHHINNQEINTLLEKCGYCNSCSLDCYLNTLKERLHDSGEFPHEIGCFLNYPICDVQGFMENKGKNYRHSGLWKIYDNVEQGVNLQKLFERCRDLYINATERCIPFQNIRFTEELLCQ